MNASTQGTHPQAGRGPGNAPVGDPGVSLVVHPITGEVMQDLSAYDEDVLADALVQLREYKARVDGMRKLVDDELRRRVVERGVRPGRVWVTGEYELKTEHASVWDADELEGVLRGLVDDGELDARDAVGIVTHVPKVNATAAGRLLDRLDGAAHAAVKACRTWKVKGLSVTRSQPLIPE